ncbi:MULTISPECIES: sugar phosphate isomerase/epimerase [unclassified Streptomyces]|uniref:sugar phosphate isomerase/epimerase family protein n=1 Tax=unclassified Streptomyces TaxID=2593676 RepID=UPI002E14A0C3|nr:MULTISPECIES: sugar phosphate isomerase/epimerase [unclassified Streptomyces]WSR22676.1 sugar phosphate isomerase/epimerase [Streptomyces sp. NBC_01205]
MRYAFSTLGLPGAPLDRSAALAAAHGYDGLELRAHPEEPLHPDSPSADRAKGLRTLTAAGVAALGVAGYARVASPGADEPVLAELQALVRLAGDLEAPYVRVFPGGADQSRALADAHAVRRLAAAAPFAERHGVRILLETHDSHRTGAAAARVLDRVAHSGAGALWDVLHTWLGGESPAESRGALYRHLGYVQVKDVASAQDLTPLGLGAGVLPLAEAVAAVPPDGWLCWEYEKRWYPGAAELSGQLARGREYLAHLAAKAKAKAVTCTGTVAQAE